MEVFDKIGLSGISVIILVFILIFISLTLLIKVV
jgi:hypothetical protein